MLQTLLGPDETRPANLELDKMGEIIENKGTVERPATKSRSGSMKKAQKMRKQERLRRKSPAVARRRDQSRPVPQIRSPQQRARQKSAA